MPCCFGQQEAADRDMDTWSVIGVFLLGAASGALLTRIARIGLEDRMNNAVALESPLDVEMKVTCPLSALSRARLQ